MRASMAISSVTGNTASIAQAVRSAAEEAGWTINDVVGPNPPDDVVIVCFWCRKSTLDPKSLKFVESCSGKRVLLFGTMGGYPVGAYADRVRANVTSKVCERNECLGVFLCQGKVNPERIEMRRNLPESDPHHLDDRGLARLTEGLNHPDATDMANARAFALDYLH